VLTRPIVLALICVGFAGFAWREATAPVATWHRVRSVLRFVAANPALGVFITVLAGFAWRAHAGAIAALDRNRGTTTSPTPADQAPARHRRPARAVLVPAGSARTAARPCCRRSRRARLAPNIHLIDKGLGFGVALLVMIGHARERRTHRCGSR